jgi:hypothetical protein
MKNQPARSAAHKALNIFLLVFLFSSLISGVLVVSNRDLVMQISQAYMEGKGNAISRENTSGALKTKTTTTTGSSTTTTTGGQAESEKASREQAFNKKAPVTTGSTTTGENKSTTGSTSNKSGAIESCGGGISTSACFCTTSNCYWNDSTGKTYSIPKGKKKDLTHSIELLGATENYAQLSYKSEDKTKDIPLTNQVVETLSQKPSLKDAKFQTLIDLEDTQKATQKSAEEALRQQIYDNCTKAGISPSACNDQLAQLSQTISNLTGPKRNAALRDYLTQHTYQSEPTLPTDTDQHEEWKLSQKQPTPEKTYTTPEDDSLISLSLLNNMVSTGQITPDAAKAKNSDYSPVIPQTDNQPSQPFTFYTQKQAPWGNQVAYQTIDGDPVLFGNVSCGATVIANILRLANIEEITPPEVYQKYLPNDSNLLLGDGQVIGVLQDKGLEVKNEKLPLNTLGEFTNAGYVAVLSVDMGANNKDPLCNLGADCADHFTLLTESTTDSSGNTTLILQDPYYGKMSCTASNDMECKVPGGGTIKYKVYDKYKVKIQNNK